MMESQIETMKSSISALKSNKKGKKEKKEKKPKYVSPPTTSKSNGKQLKPSASKKKSKKPVADNDVLSFDQKKDLSQTIMHLDGAKLEKVISIIHEGVPEIRDVRFRSAYYTGCTDLIAFAEYGGNRTGYRFSPCDGAYKTLQLCAPSSATRCYETEQSRHWHWHWRAEAQEHG